NSGLGTRDSERSEAGLRAHGGQVQVVNVGGDEVLSIREMAEIIRRVLERPPVFEEVAGASGGDTVGDVTRLRQVFRLPQRLTTFAEGVRSIVLG
ncbi:MAG TPA: hypothetical protein VHN78_01275, partial [Chloroflexota bacterium]|nr:hypothetical protein [Chloroflexota bacterium]